MTTYIQTVDMGRDRSRSNFCHIFQRFGIPQTVIEIGCFEGVTTCWLSDTIRANSKFDFQIYAIDPHNSLFANDKLIENKNEKYDWNIIKKTFEYNVSKSAGNISYINKCSSEALIDLIQQKIQAELIFVDGDHTSAAVLEDLILSWRLLKVGGIILCDDLVGFQYTDSKGNSPVQLSPRMGIESFIQAFWHKIELIHLPNSFQIAFIKKEN